jgi:hypothetical protein
VYPRDGGRVEIVHGVCAIPGPRAYDGIVDHLDTPGISHVQETAAARAAYLHVLYPALDAGQAGQARASAATLSLGTGEAAIITTDRGEDVFFVRDSTAAAGAPFEVQGWQSDARIAWLRSRQWFAVYEARSLAVASEMVFESTQPLRSLCLWPEGEGLAATVEAARRDELVLYAEWPIGQVFLNNVLLPDSLIDGRAAHIPLPSIGLYSVRIRPHLDPR